MIFVYSDMFIKEIKKKNKGSDKEYISHRLVESYRTEKRSLSVPSSIQTQLQSHNIHMQGWNIQKQLSSHVRTTTAMTTKDGRRIHIRKSTEPEPFHRLIYDALGLSYYPLKSKQVEF